MTDTDNKILIEVLASVEGGKPENPKKKPLMAGTNNKLYEDVGFRIHDQAFSLLDHPCFPIGDLHRHDSNMAKFVHSHEQIQNTYWL